MSYSSWISTRIADSDSPIGQTISTTLYILAIIVVVIVVILVVDNLYPFLPINPFGGPSSLARDVKRFWKTANLSDENLIVPASDSPTVRPDVYTVSVQIGIGDSRSPSLGNYRHILHRGSNPCSITATKSGSSGHAGIQASDLPPSTESSYKDLGLPAIMNPGIFLDKYKNDIHIFVHTRSSTENIVWLESMTVEDLPLKTPLNLGIVCNGKNLEVYVNCKLYSTLILKGIPYLPSASNQWFGRYCASPMYGIVKNLQLWDAALGSSDYMQMCRSLTLGSFDIPNICATASEQCSSK